MTMTSNDIRELLWNTLEGIYGTAYTDYTPECYEMFTERAGEGPYIRETGFSGLGYARKKAEGQGISYDDMSTTFTAEYQPDVWALGFRITEEAFDDNKYMEVGLDKTEHLIRSMKQTKEIVHARIYDRAFNSAYAVADGIELCSLVHKIYGGGTYANELATPANLSESAVEQACIDIAKLRDDRGLLLNIKPQKLITSTDNGFNTARILDSQGRPGTTDNDINAIKALGVIPSSMISHYVESATQWFIKTDCPKGMQSFTLKKPTFSRMNDWETGDFKSKGSERYVPGNTDPRGIFGSAGA